jgi:hypothetical protein
MNIFGEVVYGYSRARAIEDGVLVDVSAIAKESGFNCPVALTAGAWADCVAWSNTDSHRQSYQDESGRLWDVLWLARQAAQGGQGDRLQFEVYRIPRGGRGIAPRRTRLEMTIGPGGSGESVITVMLPGED